MKKSLCLCYCAFVTCLALAVPVAIAQNSNIAVFAPVYVRPALGSTSGQPDKSTPPVNFNTSTLNLNCSVSPIQAVLTSSPSAGTTNANLLVDNFINLTVTPGTSGTAAETPVDICSGGTSNSSSSSGTDHSQECYTPGFSSAVGNLVGQNPDTFVGTYGVAALDISSNLLSGPQQARFDLANSGDYLASSSLYLNTNCTQIGISGQVNLTGNTISSSNITQNYSIDSTSNQKFQFVYDLSKAQQAGSLSITSGTVPYIAEIPVDPTTFEATLAPRTSFATSSCMIHTGELLNGLPACALYTLQCTSGASTTPSGAQCPVSSLPNEIFQDVFDGPSFTLPDIATPNNGPTFHEGVGFLMASEGWTGGPCTFDAASGLQELTCPQNLLADFSGPGLYTSSGYTSHPNSTFIPVTGVPEDLTTVTVQHQHPGYWVNTQNPVVTLSSQPPVVAGTNLPGSSSFIASPIQSIIYGISSANSVQPSPSAPASTDTTVASDVVCPLQANPSDPAATIFATPNETLTVPADGKYLVHYFAKDCAGTEELQFTQNASTSSWSTSYYTYPINVDTVSPIVNSGPTLSPAANTLILGDYIVGQAVTATYSCTDERSGVVTCGSSTYSPASTTLNTGTITSNVNTSKTGAQTYTVDAIDAAGNQSSKSSNYTVIAYDPGIVITQQNSKIDVSVSPISGHPATGSVELYLGITPYQSAKLSGSGVAHFSTSGLHGTYSVSAVYSGNLSAPVTLTF
ncbi:MAG TPA: Ig-like domain-containing protein [Acidobacteriaceae bacterium]|nr:Ig-like domain-containing protein [Acidobacteriaceae bacterium]